MNADICQWCFSPKGHDDTVCPACGWQPGKEEVGPYLPLGSVLGGKYLVGRPLGQGGFGITYLCWDLNLAVRVAVKEFYPQQLGSRPLGATNVSPFSGKLDDFTYGLNQFLAEARVLARFRDHPGIVSILDYFPANETGYMVMEHLDGCTFDRFLATNGNRIDPRLAASILLPVMDALRAVHQEGLIHRDISPDNVFLLQDQRVKVLDFGAARQAVGARSRGLSVILKEGFAPLEQYQSNGNQGPWTDVYALAATYHRAITGQLPPPSIDRLGNDTYQPPSALGIEIPAAVEQVLVRGLSVQIDGRYPDMDSFGAALRQAVAGQAVDAPPAAAVATGKQPAKQQDTPRATPRWPMLAGGGAALAVAVAGGWLWFSGAQEREYKKQVPELSAAVSRSNDAVKALADQSVQLQKHAVGGTQADIDPQVLARSLRNSTALFFNVAKKQERRDIMAASAANLKPLAETSPDIRGQYEQSLKRVENLDREIGTMVQEYALSMRAVKSVSEVTLAEALDMETSQSLPDERLRPAYGVVGDHARAVARGELSDDMVRRDVLRLAKDFSGSR